MGLDNAKLPTLAEKIAQKAVEAPVEDSVIVKTIKKITKKK